MAFDSRDLMINLPSATGEIVGYQLTCLPMSPAKPPDDKGKPPKPPKPPCPAPSAYPKPPLKPGTRSMAAGLPALRQQLRQTLHREL
jgi:hypothetical protein